MKSLKFTLILVLCISCTKQSKPKEVNTKSKEVIEENIISQTLKDDSILYINSINYFPKTNEFYVPLSFSKPFDNKIHDILREKTDSVIYDNGETSRERLPLNIAKEALDFRQLEEVKVYSAHHQFITNAKFKRAEYFDDLNGGFIAVFTPKDKVSENIESFYCIGMAKVHLKKIKAQTIEDEELSEKIKKELNIVPQYISRVEHIRIQPYNSILSIYAYVGLDGQAISYLTEYKNDKIAVLHMLKDEVVFNGFMPTAIEKNGKPVLLIHMILPDSDAVDEYVVATFNNSEYILEKNNLISLK